MNLTLWRYDLRRAAGAWAGGLLGATALAFLPSGPLTHEGWRWLFEAFGAAIATLLAWRLFCDTGHTQAFVFSRGFSRSRLFWNRWTLGLVLLATIILYDWLLLVTGLRSEWRQRLGDADGEIYPLVASYETTVIAPLATAALLAFAITALLVVVRGLQKPSRMTGSSGILTWWMIDAPLCALLAYGTMILTRELPFPWMLPAVGIAIVPLATLAAWHGYRHLEVS